MAVLPILTIRLLTIDYRLRTIELFNTQPGHRLLPRFNVLHPQPVGSRLMGFTKIHLQVACFGYSVFLMFHYLAKGIHQVHFQGSALKTHELNHDILFGRIWIDSGLDSAVLRKGNRFDGGEEFLALCIGLPDPEKYGPVFTRSR